MSSESMLTEPISTPTESTHFKFLDLPRELRDIIYEYALWEPDGLFYYRNTAYTATFSASKDNPHEETNQLQHICRQIQQETKGLEFKVNDLIFLHDALDPIRTSAYLEQTPAMQLLGYLDMSLESQQRLLRTVRLRDTSLELERLNDRSYMQDLHSVAHWCQRHPETLVFWEFPLNRGRGQEYPESLLLDGLMFATAYRLSFPVDKWLSRLNLNTLWCNATIYRSMWQAGNKCCSYRPHCWGRSKNCVKVADAENFRIVPEDGPLREKEFREAVVKGRSGDVSQDYVDGCLELARIFYYDGI